VSGGVEIREVAPDEAEMRLDRWFRRHYPGLGHGRLEKLLRTGQIRVDGGRAKAGLRLAPGQRVRVPPLGVSAPLSSIARKQPPPPPSPEEAEALRARVLHRDADVIAIDKPAGLAVQGGTGTRRHLDAMLDALRFEAAERPRLVHRLDRDTSGVLLLARNARAAARLGAAFRSRRLRKLYWALVVGLPPADAGEIALALAKRKDAGGERAQAGEEGKAAFTRYAVIETAGRRAAWLALQPGTGRTHQIRVHCAALGTPIQGDGKYGGAAAFLKGEGIARRLHLHARAIEIPAEAGGPLRIVAPLPAHMRETWAFLGFDFDPADPLAGDPFGVGNGG